MNSLTSNLFLGLTLSSLMAFGGYYKRALSPSGAFGAILVGTAIFSFGDWYWGLVLIAFFVSSSSLSFFKKKEKGTLAEKYDKGHQRDLGQVLANGGVGAVCAIMNFSWSGEWWWFAFLGSVATVNADTWATELGALSSQAPRLITNGKIVAAGTSGGITTIGTFAALAGALFIAVVAWFLLWSIQAVSGVYLNQSLHQLLLIGGSAGLSGALLDSWLGATRQVMYCCPVCCQETEQAHHQMCHNTPTIYTRGWIWLSNDWVNFISSFGGSILAVILSTIFMFV